MSENANQSIGVAKDIATTLEKAEDTINFVNNIAVTLAEKFAGLIKQIPPEFIQMLIQLPEKYNIALKNIEIASDVLADAGWTLHMLHFTPELLHVVGTHSREELDAYFYNYYSKNNNEILIVVFRQIQENSNIAQWKNLIDECINAYQNNYKLIMIPCLISIIEGLISKVLNNPQSTKIMKPCNDIAKEKDGVDKLVWLSIYKFIKRLFDNHDFGDMRPVVINRNWILHGRDETNWEQVDAIRLFVAIHTLVFAIEKR